VAAGAVDLFALVTCAAATVIFAAACSARIIHAHVLKYDPDFAMAPGLSVGKALA